VIRGRVLPGVRGAFRETRIETRAPDPAHPIPRTRHRTCAGDTAVPHRHPAQKATATVEIWINPACSKCRSALSLLDAEGAEYTVRRYLDDPPTPAELTEVLSRLGLEPWDIARTGEPAAAELDLASWPRDAAARDRWIAALAGHPTLIQRPIITAEDGTTVIGRTESAVRSVLPPSTIH
jgi:arsenate reductase